MTGIFNLDVVFIVSHLAIGSLNLYYGSNLLLQTVNKWRVDRTLENRMKSEPFKSSQVIEEEMSEDEIDIGYDEILEQYDQEF